MKGGDFIYFLFGTAPGLILLVIVASLIAIGCDEAACSQVSETTGHKTTYRVLTGCYVKVENRYIPLDSWRGEYEGTKP